MRCWGRPFVVREGRLYGKLELEGIVGFLCICCDLGHEIADENDV
jgi:hypothetical protein